MNPSEVPSSILESMSFETRRPSEGVSTEDIGGGIAPSAETGMIMEPLPAPSQEPESGGSLGISEGLLDLKSPIEVFREAGSVDTDAYAHGNWTIDNAKTRLQQFFEQSDIKSDYCYSVVEKEGCRSFVAEITIYIKTHDCTLTAREVGSSQLIATDSCALSLVRQLYHLGVIDAFIGPLNANRRIETTPPHCEVGISLELEKQISDVLRDMNIEPLGMEFWEESEEPISILNNAAASDFFPSSTQLPKVLPWAPPSPNWNTWTCSAIDEDPLGEMSLDDISKNMEKELRDRLQKEEVLQRIMKSRQELPIAASKREIMNMINDNAVCIIRGNTGCGKTTQVAQFILDDYIQVGQGAHCNIIVTQPERVSTLTLAERVAYERGGRAGVDVGVGYSLSFEATHPRPHGSILFCTADTFIKKLENGLRGVSHVIVDEVHKRDINTDFILIVLRDMINTYPDLRLILMSATMDTTRFSDYFSGCPVVEIRSPCFPVQEYFLEDAVQLVKFFPSAERKKRKRYRQGRREDEDDDDTAASEDGGENLNLNIDSSYLPDTKYALSLMNEKEIYNDLIRDILIHIKNRSVKGAILIFLPDWRDIASLMRYLQQSIDFSGQDYVILPLHSCLPLQDQRRVFETYPSNVTKVILTTNIAESSITIDDVVYVIDTCKTKIKTFTPHNNLTQYSITWASRSSLEQRRGRAGRTIPGYCFHLCSKARYEALEEFSTPEMCRLPLYELALAVKTLDLGNISEFLLKAIEPPKMDAIREAESFLHEMKYVDRNGELTPLGRMIGRLPVEPRLGKMLILGVIFDCANPLITIAANSTTYPGLFLNTIEGRELTFHQKSYSGIRYSDHVATINLFQTWEKAKETNTHTELCGSKMLAEAALQMTTNAKYHLLSSLANVCGFPQEILIDQTLNYQGPDAKLDMVTALLAAGLHPNIACHDSQRRLKTADDKFALINRSSVNYSHRQQSFPFPFFAYEEKHEAKTVTCKQTTLLTPLSLLLFGARKVEYGRGAIKVDGWINLKMKPSTAFSVVALREALDDLVRRVADEPSRVTKLSNTDQTLLNVIRELCKFNAGRYGIQYQVPTFQSFQSRRYRLESHNQQGYNRNYRRGNFRGRGVQRNRQEFRRSGARSTVPVWRPRPVNVRTYFPGGFVATTPGLEPRGVRHFRFPSGHRAPGNQRILRGGRGVAEPVFNPALALFTETTFPTGWS